jgi:hypothetical protein
MAILGLRILPPLAIARFGSSTKPLEAFELEVDPKTPLDFRRIVPQPSLEIDPKTGRVVRQYTPENICFRDGEKIRPVAPFLEVFAQTSEHVLEPLTLALLKAEGLTAASLRWTVHVGNLKVFRQTEKPEDQVLARVEIADHQAYELRGECVNFRKGRYISFGHVRYIEPTEEFPQIRLRFTPGRGLVYGASLERINAQSGKPEPDPVFDFDGGEDRIVYDPERGTWRGFQANFRLPTVPNPSDIYESYITDPNELGISRGYLDDVCDGPVILVLQRPNAPTLTARAWVSACMPVFALDSQPIRTVSDELEQLILGPEVDDAEVSVEEAAEIVRRALETIRLMNTLVMNGNVIEGRANIAHTLGTQDTNDHGRLYAPIMAASLVDNLAVRALHERVYAALLSGSAPWFADVLRRPEEVADLSDQGRRKMPPMLRGADSRALALTRRQISKIVKATTAGLFQPPKTPPSQT